jgi:hypothetical protein
MCCGSRRSAWRTQSINGAQGQPAGAPRTVDTRPRAQPALPVTASSFRPPPAPEHLPPVSLRYTETVPMRVWGAVTGRCYDFEDSETPQLVDPRDAAVLTRGGLFLRVSN